MFRIYNQTIMDHPYLSNGVILLQHGFLGSSDDFIEFDPQSANKGDGPCKITSPALMWACKNYDVWVANNRGNKYSQL
jgi:pimeloyl-ACP methyl ester carboxylesterase